MTNHTHPATRPSEVTVTDRQLGAVLAVVLPHVRNEPDLRWSWTSVQLSYDGRELWAVGTDHHTLAVASTIVIHGGRHPWQVCLPYAEAARILAGCPDVEAEEAARRAAEAAVDEADVEDDTDEVLPDYPPRPTTRVALAPDGDQLRLHVPSDIPSGHPLAAATANLVTGSAARGDTYPRWRELVKRALSQPPRPIAGIGVSPGLLARWAAIREPLTLWGATPALGTRLYPSGPLLLTAVVDTLDSSPIEVIGLQMPRTPRPPITLDDVHARWGRDQQAADLTAPARAGAAR